MPDGDPPTLSSQIRRLLGERGLLPPAAFERVTEVAQGVPTWKITYSDPAKTTLEAVATSWLFHFHDDIVIQIRPTPDGESLIVMRSKSRDGPRCTSATQVERYIAGRR